MREVISVHVGQAGVQIGNACCEFFSPLFFLAFHVFFCREGYTLKRVVSVPSRPDM
jgi:hypothetical protein